MPDRESKRNWDRENTTVITMKLHNRNDADILDAIKDQPKQTVLKELIRAALKLTPEQRKALTETAAALRDGANLGEAIRPVNEQRARDGMPPISAAEIKPKGEPDEWKKF